MRLHRYIAQCGVTSRRKAETLILEGRVEVNGAVVRELGVKVGDGDVVEVDGARIGLAEPVTLLLNKPRGYVTTTSDERRRRTVMDLIPDVGPVKPVGRLDMDSDGLLLLTSDGDLAALLTHAKHGVEKEYRVRLSGVPDDGDLRRLRSGMVIDGRKTDRAIVDILSAENDGGSSLLSFVIHEGRNRQIRKMGDAIGHPVITLSRIRIGHLTLKTMHPGECRKLGVKDVERLRALAKGG